MALATEALAEARARGDYAVLALEPRDRDLSVPSGLVAPDPKQYAVLTVARREQSYLRSTDYFVDYYRQLLASEVSR